MLAEITTGKARRDYGIIERLGGTRHWSEATGTNLNVTVEGPDGGGRMGTAWRVGTGDRLVTEQAYLGVTSVPADEPMEDH